MLFLCGGGKISAGYRNHGKVRVKHMTQIDKNIAFNLKRIRKSKNMSLDMLAERTGVSKSMLGQIERRIQSHGVHYREDRGGIEGTF